MTTYCKYKAPDDKSYNALAAHVVTLPVTATLFPDIKTVSLPEEAQSGVDSFIEDKKLDITKTAVEVIVCLDKRLVLNDDAADATILREIAHAYRQGYDETLLANGHLEEKIAALEKELSEVKADAEVTAQSRDYHLRRVKQMKEQLRAIGTILAVIDGH